MSMKCKKLGLGLALVAQLGLAACTGPYHNKLDTSYASSFNPERDCKPAVLTEGLQNNAAGVGGILREGVNIASGFRGNIPLGTIEKVVTDPFGSASRGQDYVTGKAAEAENRVSSGYNREHAINRSVDPRCSNYFTPYGASPPRRAYPN